MRVQSQLLETNKEIMIIVKNQRVAKKALQGITNKLGVWAAERNLSFSPIKNSNHDFQKKRKRNQYR